MSAKVTLGLVVVVIGFSYFDPSRSIWSPFKPTILKVVDSDFSLAGSPAEEAMKTMQMQRMNFLTSMADL